MVFDFLKRFAPCSCVRIQDNEEGSKVNETMTISIKNTCCKRVKSINIHITPDNIDAIKDIKEIMDRIEFKAIQKKRLSNGEL